MRVAAILINTVALARWPSAHRKGELFQQFVRRRRKPLKRLDARRSPFHRAKAAVLMRIPSAACGQSRSAQCPSPLILRPSAFALRPSAFGFPLLLAFVLFASTLTPLASSPDTLFQAGATAYRAGEYARAAEAFRQSVALQPASGTLQDLGNAEWQCHRAGAAILAWEQARWLDPFNQSARQNLRFARKTAQLEDPDLAWYEVVSTWLPASWWAWIAGLSLWLTVAMGILPGVLRQRKATWHQAMAALGLMVFLLSVPAYIGVQTRSRIGFVLRNNTPFRLTPTLEAQAVTQLAAGEPGRWVRSRGNYVLIRTNRALGWVERNQFGLACPRTRKEDWLRKATRALASRVAPTQPTMKSRAASASGTDPLRCRQGTCINRYTA